MSTFRQLGHEAAILPTDVRVGDLIRWESVATARGYEEGVVIATAWGDGWIVVSGMRERCSFEARVHPKTVLAVLVRK